MRVFVTGAAGFLGRATAEGAAAAGHEVLALYRPAAPLELGGVRAVAGDLRQPGDWQQALGEAEAVIHCAAAASGDLAAQLAGTVLATENLLAALPPGLRRFVHVSSFSVYDYAAPGPFGAITETSPLEPNPLHRDAYTQTKLLQEEMVRAHCRERGIELVVVRPGAIYGPGKDWDFGAAMRAGRFDLIFAPLARMRLIHVTDCARALVAALDAPIEHRELVVNAVGRDQPTHWSFHRTARRAGGKTGVPVPIPYALVRALGGAAALASRVFFGGRARLPELLDLPRQQARWRGLRYPASNSGAQLLGSQSVPLREGVKTITKK
ncbi:NAD-dependent epimerase/dehydratase family protein [Qipengyuania sediminis]|uniref:NAD-dependent epimerase/dehydratase family protein n=1 Tax=Qipengyuania sediminis TaxID=1532023 RepID=UPI00105A8FF6|nr:NAD(P)-dependent oxidoreductase [Qipengyuania sediminis]